MPELLRVSELMNPRKQPAGGAAPAADALLLEDGDNLLLEDGSNILLE
jgi:hypothetical protein